MGQECSSLVGCVLGVGGDDPEPEYEESVCYTLPAGESSATVSAKARTFLPAPFQNQAKPKKTTSFHVFFCFFFFLAA